MSNLFCNRVKYTTKNDKRQIYFTKFPGRKPRSFRSRMNARPRELDHSAMLKKHLYFRLNCGIIILHGGGGFHLSQESATAPFGSGITM